MKINWKVRFKNKTWLITFAAAVLGLVYQILGICGVVPGLSQNVVLEILSAAVDLLVMLGVVIDPTTSGSGDSIRALGYDKPWEDHDDE